MHYMDLKSLFNHRGDINLYHWTHEAKQSQGNEQNQEIQVYKVLQISSAQSFKYLEIELLACI